MAIVVDALVDSTLLSLDSRAVFPNLFWLAPLFHDKEISIAPCHAWYTYQHNFFVNFTIKLNLVKR